MGNYACNLYWDKVPTYGGAGYISSIDTMVSNPSRSQFFSLAAVAMEQNKPVILGYVTGYDSSGKAKTHYVAVNAVYGQGTSLSDYGCIDPAGGSYKNLYDVIGSKTLYKMVIYNR